MDKELSFNTRRTIASLSWLAIHPGDQASMVSRTKSHPSHPRRRVSRNAASDRLLYLRLNTKVSSGSRRRQECVAGLKSLQFGQDGEEAMAAQERLLYGNIGDGDAVKQVASGVA